MEWFLLILVSILEGMFGGGKGRKPYRSRKGRGKYNI